mmetsp:Transcript_17497/g.36907  ORF Transcript_17497/g.36907 Transcript_17497/m.36907 type:complete len:338 (+) Transcript_17497:226-1239(+)|eukprot:CAMPEP_0183725538 /NCGR_PEP_ID=MMETSP0737-20130205/20734_1 /TAXON_ID=385413 /ORGANISM="Thalassiosira miniscula, Strain CCMP1093" /LENGTH=337 /DNA_ID=CAMNT_0025956557 /DNA_START=194 /DNA_END=1207 /DNA_ORIENTATION=+
MNGSAHDVPIPDGWSRGVSRTLSRPYYFHRASRHTQWHFPTPSEARDPSGTKRRMSQEQQQKLEKKRKKLNSVAIIVPYRDLHPSQNRAKHLQQFIPHMKRFLSELVASHKIQDYHVYIIEQSDDGRKFNRGKLLNIGFDYALKRSEKHPPRHNVFIFHDVDLLPQSDLGDWYARFPTKPTHIARVWDRYANNPKYFGGIVSFSEKDMRTINGYPNTFWGWGGEDDEMQKRLETTNITWEAPDHGTIVDLEDMDLSTKLGFLKKNKEWKCMVKWEALEEHPTTWNRNGLADLKYGIKMIKRMDKEDGGESKVTKLTTDVQLNANHWANDKCGVDYLP